MATSSSSAAPPSDSGVEEEYDERGPLLSGDSRDHGISHRSSIVSEKSRRTAFISTLEDTAEKVEKLLALVEDENGGPLVSEDDIMKVSQSLVFCADNLTRIDETLMSASKEAEKEAAAESARHSMFALEDMGAEEVHEEGRDLQPHGRVDFDWTKSNQSRNSSRLFVPNANEAAHVNETTGNRRSRALSNNTFLSHIWFSRGEVRRKKPRFTRTMIRWLAFAGLVWQILSLSLFVGLSQLSDTSNSQWVRVILAALATFQLCHVLMTIALMYKIGMQIAHHTICFETLVQSYLSTIVAMAGVYFLFMAIDHTSFDGLSKWKSEATGSIMSEDPGRQVEVLLHMIYFSSTTMTGCGFGDITPRSWYAVLCVTMEQLLSVTFSTVIFGLALQHFTTRLTLRKNAIEKKVKEQQVEWANALSH